MMRKIYLGNLGVSDGKNRDGINQPEQEVFPSNIRYSDVNLCIAFKKSTEGTILIFV